ncbi:MAG: hypothetical protein IH866_03375 [Chloroflexi bacterium]|nr:hypothetical protein [Chloroflexota bacterium]
MVSIALVRNRSVAFSLPPLDGIGLLTCVLYLLFFGFGFASFTDPDYWWHLRTGEQIVETFSIPRHDVFSFTATGASLLNHQWLSEVTIYLSVSWFGYAATLGFFIAVTLASFALMQRLLLRLGTPRAIALGLIALAMLISAPFWTVRPQLLSWFLLAVFVNTLVGRTKTPWLLVPLLALWANVHLGYILGLGVVSLWLLSHVWLRFSGERSINLRGMALFVAACFGASLLNPNGATPLVELIDYLPFTSDAVAVQGITELEAPNFGQPIHLPLLAGILVLIGLTLAGRVQDRFVMLLAIVFTALALQTARFQPIFALAFLPAAGLAARDLATRARKPGEPPRSLVNWGLVAVATLAVVAAIPQLPNAQVHRQANTDGRTYYPAQALAWVQEERPEANVFTSHMWGGYFIYGLYPEGHVYIDGRSNMYGPDRFVDYRTIINANDDWQTVLEDSGADTVIIERAEKLSAALLDAEGWSLALETPRDRVFVRG